MRAYRTAATSRRWKFSRRQGCERTRLALRVVGSLRQFGGVPGLRTRPSNPEGRTGFPTAVVRLEDKAFWAPNFYPAHQSPVAARREVAQAQRRREVGLRRER